MEEKYKHWHIWSGSLKRWGIEELAASLLEFSGPLNILMAQLVYIGEPFLASSGNRSGFKALGTMLENGAETQEFVTYLREEMAT